MTQAGARRSKDGVRSVCVVGGTGGRSSGTVKRAAKWVEEKCVVGRSREGGGGETLES